MTASLPMIFFLRPDARYCGFVKCGSPAVPGFGNFFIGYLFRDGSRLSGAGWGCQGSSHEKWFNTNYHYLVPEIDSAPLQISGSKPFDEFLEARSYGIETKPVLIGPFTFLTLSSLAGGRTRESVAGELARAYAAILARFHELDAAWVQLDEPALVRDLDRQDIDLFLRLYESMLPSKGRVKVLLQTYFGDIRDCYEQVAGLDIDAVGLDFVEGKQSLSLVKEYGFPKDKLLLAGVVNGKNIWRNHYSRTLALLADLKKRVPA